MARRNGQGSPPQRSLRGRVVRLRPKSDRDRTDTRLLDELVDVAQRVDPGRFGRFLTDQQRGDRMVKSTPQEWEVQALKLYAEGSTATSIAAELGVNVGTLKSSLGRWKERGVLSGSHKEKAGPTVDWQRLEEVMGKQNVEQEASGEQVVGEEWPPKVGLQRAQNNQRNIEQASGLSFGKQEQAESLSQAKQEQASVLSFREQVALKGALPALLALAARFGLAPGVERTGERELFNVRLDKGLVAAIRARAKERGLSQSKAAEEAFMAWLR